MWPDHIDEENTDGTRPYDHETEPEEGPSMSSTSYVHHVMRHAKPTNIKESYAQLLIIYGSIDLILHGLIPALTPDITPDQFIQACKA